MGLVPVGAAAPALLGIGRAGAGLAVVLGGTRLTTTGRSAALRASAAYALLVGILVPAPSCSAPSSTPSR